MMIINKPFQKKTYSIFHGIVITVVAVIMILSLVAACDHLL